MTRTKSQKIRYRLILICFPPISPPSHTYRESWKKKRRRSLLFFWKRENSLFPPSFFLSSSLFLFLSLILSSLENVLSLSSTSPSLFCGFFLSLPLLNSLLPSGPPLPSGILANTSKAIQQWIIFGCVEATNIQRPEWRRSSRQIGRQMGFRVPTVWKKKAGCMDWTPFCLSFFPPSLYGDNADILTAVNW